MAKRMAASLKKSKFKTTSASNIVFVDIKPYYINLWIHRRKNGSFCAIVVKKNSENGLVQIKSSDYRDVIEMCPAIDSHFDVKNYMYNGVDEYSVVVDTELEAESTVLELAQLYGYERV